MMDIDSYNELAALLLEVPELVKSYEGSSPHFPRAVLEWATRVEATMKRKALPEVSKVSALKAHIISAERGLLSGDNPALIQRIQPSRRKYVEATAAQAVAGIQLALHGILAPYEARYVEAAQTVRKMVIDSSQAGILNGHFKKGLPEEEGMPVLFQSMMACEPLKPYGTHVLELVSYGDALRLLRDSIAEWVESYQKYFKPA